MILCIGEITQDYYINYDTKTFVKSLGGAPFNVAVVLKKLGCPVGFYGCLGKNDQSMKTISDIEKISLDYLKIDITDKADSPFVFIIEENNEARYISHCKNTSDKFLSYKSIAKKISDFSIIHFGSIMIADKKMRKFMNKIIRKAHKLNIKISFDVNYREDVFSSLNYARKLYTNILKKVDIVKFSKNEICKVFNKNENQLYDAISDMAKYKKIFFVTLGKDGAIYYKDGFIKKIESINTKVFDTTGAGDSFFAGVLSQLSGYNHYSNIDMDYVTKYGNICGAIATRCKGITESNINKREIEKIIKNFKDVA